MRLNHITTFMERQKTIPSWQQRVNALLKLLLPGLSAQEISKLTQTCRDWLVAKERTAPAQDLVQQLYDSLARKNASPEDADLLAVARFLANTLYEMEGGDGNSPIEPGSGPAYVGVELLDEEADDVTAIENALLGWVASEALKLWPNASCAFIGHFSDSLVDDYSYGLNVRNDVDVQEAIDEALSFEGDGAPTGDEQSIRYLTGDLIRRMDDQVCLISCAMSAVDIKNQMAMFEEGGVLDEELKQLYGRLSYLNEQRRHVKGENFDFVTEAMDQVYQQLAAKLSSLNDDKIPTPANPTHTLH